MSRCTTADCFILDISLIKHAWVQGWQSGHVTWTWPQQRYDLAYSLVPGIKHRVLAYHWVEPSWGSVEEAWGLPYESVPTPVGGSRIYWSCPRCTRHVQKLYLPRGNLTFRHSPNFYCRHCYGLPYASQYESRSYRTWRRYFEFLDELRDPATTFKRLQKIESDVDRISHEITRKTGRRQHSFEGQRPKRPGRPSRRRQREVERALRAAERSARPKRPVGRPRAKRAYVRRTPVMLSEKHDGATQAYCPRCRDRRELVEGKVVVFRNGRTAVQGICATCGSKMARITGTARQ